MELVTTTETVMKHLNIILTIVLALGFLFFGVMKFVESPNLVFSIIAKNSGMAFFEPYVRMATGIAELGTAALLLLPKTRKLGVFAALGVLIGAIGFHLSPWLGINVPGIGHGLFLTALAMFVLALILASRIFRKA